MTRVALVLLVLCSVPSSAFAWIRERFEDAEVVARSELIVVAHLEPGSIQYADNAGGLWEHHATLVITETLKGRAVAARIPVIIHYGLDPLLEGKMSNAHASWNLSGSFPKGSVQIVDGGGAGGDPLVADATQDNIWLLRRRSGAYGREPGTGDFGIVDPQDLRPLADKTLLSLYLARDPEVAIRAYVATHPDADATRYLDHREVQRILHAADPVARARQLLPFFERNQRWGMADEAFDGIVAAGAAAAGPALATMFAATDHRHRTEIIGAWGRMRYAGAVDTLVAVLRTTDLYWSTQRLSGDWWNAAAGSPLTLQRQERYGDVFEAVIALHKIGDRRAKPTIELTLRRWKAINFRNPQIVDECEAALRDVH